MTETRRRRPRKALGQHWLRDSRYLERIAAAADIAEDDTVVEVGAGTGLLTERLARRARRLIAVEVDTELTAGLRERFAGRPEVCVVAADVLSLPPDELLVRGGGRLPYVVVGNLPYFIGSATVRHFLTATVQPRRLVVTLQAEVGQSMAAAPGRMTYLSVETQLFAEARLLFCIPPRAFRPPPKVRSAVVRLDVRDGTAIEVDDRGAFLRFAQAGFAAPRKHLRNSLAVGLRVPAGQAEAVLTLAGIDPALRPAALGLEDWRRLYRAYRQLAPGGEQ
ncbi:MAG TPA: 16S rRNA (adenine(1518)-N(6)/adenine(1519)-N(6))-dimethyltransferase RsmA [Dehalococcoidia bacterium]|nr:16S rRNA (adenine(1518)-N(6)/adenine(1519)-N(6))-dimethyltransferase RsmA [Dehalococcoidia bacterium]